VCVCLCASPKCWHRAGAYVSISVRAGGGLIAVFAGSNPVKDVEVRLLCLLCVVQVADFLTD
jgi:hypothetical protein